jgi:hypothetical protein
MDVAAHAPDFEEVSAVVLDLLADRERGATICPSEVARKLVDASSPNDTESWRSAMPTVHAAVDRLVHQGTIKLSWKGEPLTVRSGPYRIGLVG